MAVLPMILTLSFVTHPERVLEQRFHHFASQVLLEISHCMITHLQSKVLVSGIQFKLICILHQLTEPATFKSALTKYLLTIPDTPPVVGYVGANSNSLMDWSINKAVTGLQGWSQQMA